MKERTRKRERERGGKNKLVLVRKELFQGLHISKLYFIRLSRHSLISVTSSTMGAESEKKNFVETLMKYSVHSEPSKRKKMNLCTWLIQYVSKLFCTGI